MHYSVLLQAAPSSNGFLQIAMFGAIFVVFYFFMIRPQQKKQKDQRTFSDSLKKGDEVVTIGGMHGRIMEVDKDTVTLEVDRGMKLRFDKSAISLEFSKKKSS
ncbi:preprotein translocase subunit YajC [Catalinimonas alkaloidigena]|uniref:Sec translocon accessory complex subunit YajC n=1 Tax=Catalinimonas alkaloidigena TaxID=1075417 RepID=A0A1G9DE86_9BACT|nr:preprotein translocase subunit YajC [Catalinimonas alkaloidigena]SDK62183.1 preprotein translocase subunit YajC [Catalinimonas alkaloidigena]